MPDSAQTFASIESSENEVYFQVQFWLEAQLSAKLNIYENSKNPPSKSFEKSLLFN